MEKHRTSVVSRSEHIAWHSRSTLSPAHPRIEFHQLHDNPKSAELYRQEETERTIFDIVSNLPRERVQRLEIKHRTGEK